MTTSETSSYIEMSSNDNYHSFNGVRFDDEDISNSLTSDVDLPGTRPNLTSSGRLSPHRIRSLRDQETQLQELKKENFGLKLRIYHLEEQLRKRHGDLNEDWEMIIQLNVQVDELKQEKTDIELLVKDAKNAIDTYEAKIKELERELAEVIKISKEVPQLKETIKHLRKEHQEYEILARESQEEAERQRQRVEELEEENENLKRQLLNQPSPQPVVIVPACDTINKYIQTDDDIINKMKEMEDGLDEKEREIERLRGSCDMKDKKIQELELEVLRSSNKMASMATDHAHQMQTLTDEINKLKIMMEEKDEVIRERDKEILELNRQLRELQRQLREVTDTADQLRNKLRVKEDECDEKDREINDLRKRLRDSQDELDRLTNKINGLERIIRDKDEEIEKLRRLLGQKEDELNGLRMELDQLKNELQVNEGLLSTARVAAHNTSMSSQEISSHLTSEIERLQNELKLQTKLKNEAQTDVIEKGELISQLREKIRTLEKKLSEAEDMNDQLRKHEDVIRNLKRELATVRGEKDTLEEEIEQLKQEINRNKYYIDELEQQLNEKNMLLDQSKLTIDSLLEQLDELNQSQLNQDGGPTAAEMTQLKIRIQSLEQALLNKETEIGNLKQTLCTKDDIINELHNEMQKLIDEKELMKEIINRLSQEKEELENHIRELEEAAGSNNDSLEQARLAMEQLQEQVRQLERQIKELTMSPGKVSVSVETSPHKEGQSPGSNNTTTMIFGALSENLLLLILQKLDELYREIIAGRNEGTQANSWFGGKLDELSKLQRQLKSLHHKRSGRDSPDVGSALNKFDDLQRQNEELIRELELERLTSQGDTSRGGLLANVRLREMERERDRLLDEIDEGKQQINELKKRIEEMERENEKLRIEMMELRLSSLRKPPQLTSHSVTSLPDLHDRGQTHWTSITLGGERPDLSRLIEKQNEAVRLNRELQRKCQEKLHSSPPSSHVAGGGYWETRVHQMEKDTSSRRKYWEEQKRCWEEEMRAGEEKREKLKLELSNCLGSLRKKEAEILTVTLSRDDLVGKVHKLEMKLSQVLNEKNKRIKELEKCILDLEEREVMYVPAADGELKSSVEKLKGDKTFLLSQLKMCKDEVARLQGELERFHNTRDGQGHSTHHLSMGSLLEDIRSLRHQLEMSLQNNAPLADKLINHNQHHSSKTTPPTKNGSHTSFESSLHQSWFVPGASSTAHVRRTRPAVITHHNIEEKIRKVLDSPTTSCMDKEFLRELLLYLQQQKSQLDDSQRLLTDLHESSHDLPPPPVSYHVTTTCRDMSSSDDDNQDHHRSGASSCNSSIDLSLIHGQIKRTHDAINQSKKILKKTHKK